MDNLPCECIIYVLTALDNMSHVFPGIQTEEVSDDQVDVLMYFPVFRPKEFPTIRSMYSWHSGQFSGIQTEGVSDDQVDVLMALRPIFRYSDRRSFRRSGRCTHGTQANFPVFRPKEFPTIRSMYSWHSGQFSGIQTEEVSDDQVDVLMFFPVFRPKKFPTIRSMYLCFSGIQTEGVSDDQVDVLMALRPIFRYSDRRSFRRSDRCTHGTQANFPVFRPKEFPTIRSMYSWHSGQFSGIQTEGVSDDQVDVLMALRPIFQYSDRRSFRRSGRCTYGTQANFPVFRPKWHPGQFPMFQIDIKSLIHRCSVFRLTSGAQAVVIPVLPFILVSRSTFSVSSVQISTVLWYSIPVYPESLTAIALIRSGSQLIE
ncbi:hypothetical protein KIW84_074741 [Lathyrus oleraceus]|uniref:Uncharacterized protein n=1 Tax=Pisum sativum TaxID=3888 RepID=A0A9D4VT67_PEA|nr:hypothetical protein KIW84_074741 [Pisum sativum]